MRFTFSRFFPGTLRKLAVFARCLERRLRIAVPMALGLVAGAPSTVLAAPIEYDFSWVGSGSLAIPFADSNFEMDFVAHTGDVVSGTAPTPFSLNGMGPHGNLTGTFTGSGLTAQLFPFIVLIESVSADPSSRVFIQFGAPSDIDNGLDMSNAGFPGINSYDLGSAFGPVGSNGSFPPHVDPIDLGPAGTFTFTNVSSASFEAIELRAAPEPGTLGLFLIAAMGAGLARLRSRSVAERVSRPGSGSRLGCPGFPGQSTRNIRTWCGPTRNTHECS